MLYSQLTAQQKHCIVHVHVVANMNNFLATPRLHVQQTLTTDFIIL